MSRVNFSLKDTIQTQKNSFLKNNQKIEITIIKLENEIKNEFYNNILKI